MDPSSRGSGSPGSGNDPRVRVIVTGATGNVGTALIRALLRDDSVDEVVGIARRIPSTAYPEVTWRALDITRDPLLEVFAGADAVIHLAWLFQPTHRPEVTWRNNVLGSPRVFDAVAAAGTPVLVHASSVGTYSPAEHDVPVDESWPTHALPVAAYGRQKSYLERVLDTFELRHPDTRVVRMRSSFIFQESSASSQRRIFLGPFFPGPVLRPGTLPILPDLPRLRFQALHSDDVAQAYRLAVHRPVSGPLNLADRQVVTMPQIAELLGARTVEVPAAVANAAIAAAWHLHLVPASPGLLRLFLSLPLLDPGRAETELGWRPQRTSLDAVACAINGIRAGSDDDTPSLSSATSGPLR